MPTPAVACTHSTKGYQSERSRGEAKFVHSGPVKNARTSGPRGPVPCYATLEHPIGRKDNLLEALSFAHGTSSVGVSFAFGRLPGREGRTRGTPRGKPPSAHARPPPRRDGGLPWATLLGCFTDGGQHQFPLPPRREEGNREGRRSMNPPARMRPRKGRRPWLGAWAGRKTRPVPLLRKIAPTEKLCKPHSLGAPVLRSRGSRGGRTPPGRAPKSRGTPQVRGRAGTSESPGWTPHGRWPGLPGRMP